MPYIYTLGQELPRPSLSVNVLGGAAPTFRTSLRNEVRWYAHFQQSIFLYSVEWLFPQAAMGNRYMVLGVLGYGHNCRASFQRVGPKRDAMLHGLLTVQLRLTLIQANTMCAITSYLGMALGYCVYIAHCTSSCLLVTSVSLLLSWYSVDCILP
jgi:hypothetical protein